MAKEKQSASPSYIRDSRSPKPKNALVSKVMSSIKNRNTKPELLLRKALWNSGIKGYRLHWKKVPGKPDISFPGRKVAIFVHGCFWHRCPKCSLPLPKNNSKFWSDKFAKNVKRDMNKRIALENMGWTVLEIWECEIKQDLKNCVQKVKRAFDS